MKRALLPATCIAALHRAPLQNANPQLPIDAQSFPHLQTSWMGGTPTATWAACGPLPASTTRCAFLLAFKLSSSFSLISCGHCMWSIAGLDGQVRTLWPTPLFCSVVGWLPSFAPACARQECGSAALQLLGCCVCAWSHCCRAQRRVASTHCMLPFAVACAGCTQPNDNSTSPESLHLPHACCPPAAGLGGARRVWQDPLHELQRE